MSQPRGIYYPFDDNPAGARRFHQSAPTLYRTEFPTSPDVVEKDSRCYRPHFRSQRSLPCGSRDEEKDMKRTPTTPSGNPGDKSRPWSVAGSGHFDPSSLYTARGPHIQSMGAGSRTNSGSSLSSTSLSSSTSHPGTSMSSTELGGPPYQHVTGMAQYSMYNSKTRVNQGYYGRSRVTANQTFGYHHPPSMDGGQSSMRYREDTALRTGYRDQQGGLVHDTEMAYGVGSGSKYRSRVQSTGSVGVYSPPASSHYHTPGGYVSLGDRLSDPYSNRQSYSQPYKQSGGVYRQDNVLDSSYTRQYSNYSTSQYAHYPLEPPYTHNTDEYDSYQTPYDYIAEPQPMSLSASVLKVQNYEDCNMTSELSGQPVEHLSSELNSKLSLEQSTKRPTQHKSDVGDDRLQITEHPKDTRVALNQSATLSCKACVLDSKEQPNFLWYKDTEPLIGEIDSDYVVEEATEKDEGVYYCLVSHPQDDKLQKTSNSAKFTVRIGKLKDSPEIIQQPCNDVTVSIGERVKLVLKASGEAPLRYKWYKDTREMSFATTSVLEIPSASYTDSGAYCCTISNTHGSVLSNTFYVRVTTAKSAQSIPKQRPSSLHNWEDQPFTDLFLKEVGTTIAQQTRNLNRIALYFGLSNTDMVDIRVQFHRPEEQAFHILRKWSRTKRGNRRLLHTILTQAGINLELMMTNGKHSQMKPNVPKPKITIHPQSKKVLYGNSFELSIQLESTHYSQYQWYKNHKPLGGKTNPQIYVNSAVDSDSGDYYCVVTNEGGSVTSNTATIEVIVSSSRRPLPSGLPPYSQPSGPGNQPWSNSGSIKTNSRLYTGLIERGGGLPSCVETATAQPVGERKSGSVYVNSMPRILEHPQSQTVETGDPLTLTCKAEHGGHTEEELHYEWFFNGLSMQHENRPEYCINCFTDEDEGLYSCKVSNSYGDVTSNVAHVQLRVESD